jgi:hypothetical protein
VRHDVVLECSQERHVGSCRGTTTLVVKNPSAVVEELHVGGSGDVLLYLDRYPPIAIPERTISRVRIDPGVTRTLVVVHRDEFYFSNSYHIRGELPFPALWARHAYFYGDGRKSLRAARTDLGYELDFGRDSARIFAKLGESSVRMLCPSDWDVEVQVFESIEARRNFWGDCDERKRCLEPDVRERSIIGEAIELSFRSRAAEVVELDLERGLDIPFELGGPYVGLGGTWGENSAFVTRIGYEGALLRESPEGILALSAEVRTSGHVILSPTLELATPQMIFPSLSFGGGGVFAFLPEPEAGVRLLAGLQMFALGVHLNVDIWPGRGEGGATPEYTLIGRFSL